MAKPSKIADFDVIKQKILITPYELAKMSGIGINKVNKMLIDNLEDENSMYKFAIKNGRTKLCKRAVFEEYLANTQEL